MVSPLSFSQTLAPSVNKKKVIQHNTNQDKTNANGDVSSGRRSRDVATPARVNPGRPRTNANTTWAAGFYGKLGHAAMSSPPNKPRKSSSDPAARSSARASPQHSDNSRGHRHHVRHLFRIENTLSFEGTRVHALTLNTTAKDNTTEGPRSSSEPVAGHHHKHRLSHRKDSSLKVLKMSRRKPLASIPEDPSTEDFEHLLSTSSSSSETETSVLGLQQHRKFDSKNEASPMNEYQADAGNIDSNERQSLEITRTVTVDVSSAPAEDIEAFNPAQELTNYFDNHFDAQITRKAQNDGNHAGKKNRKTSWSAIRNLAAAMGLGGARDAQRN